MLRREADRVRDGLEGECELGASRVRGGGQAGERHMPLGLLHQVFIVSSLHFW